MLNTGTREMTQEFTSGMPRTEKCADSFDQLVSARELSAASIMSIELSEIFIRKASIRVQRFSYWTP